MRVTIDAAVMIADVKSVTRFTCVTLTSREAAEQVGVWRAAREASTTSDPDKSSLDTFLHSLRLLECGMNCCGTSVSSSSFVPPKII